MNKKIKTEAVDHLFDAILTLKTPDECYKFFEDVCTINELLSLSQRYEVAKMLRKARPTWRLRRKQGASTATISRVNRSLNYGSDGYDMMFCRDSQGERRQTKGIMKAEYDKGCIKKRILRQDYCCDIRFVLLGWDLLKSRPNSMKRALFYV
ncbi:MAG: YerC/YecD family TrpR-related protein [Enterocloster sp.]